MADSVTAYRAALTVYTQASHPQEWAGTQNNLAVALETQGTRTAGRKGAALLSEAVNAYSSALTVYTHKDHPVRWAMTQENLALAELAIATHDTTTDPRPHLEAALTHVEAALTMFDPEQTPFNFDKASKLRDTIRAALDTLP